MRSINTMVNKKTILVEENTTDDIFVQYVTLGNGLDTRHLLHIVIMFSIKNICGQIQTRGGRATRSSSPPLRPHQPKDHCSEGKSIKHFQKKDRRLLSGMRACASFVMASLVQSGLEQISRNIALRERTRN